MRAIVREGVCKGGRGRDRGRCVGIALAAAALYFGGGWSFFDPFHARVEGGNKQAADGKTDEAIAEYDAASQEKPESPIPDYNRALALAKAGRIDEAKNAFQAAQASPDAGIAADAHYNLGNLLFETKDTPGAIQEYLRSLDLDPTDPDARRNLEIALRRREEEQKQQQEQQQQQDQQQEPQDEGAPQDEPQDEGDPNSAEDPKKDDEQPGEQPQQDPSESAPPDSGDASSTPPAGSEGAPQEGQLSREDAARLLNAIESDELRVLRALEEKKEEEGGVADDW